MKKLVSLFLALALSLSLAVPALADGHIVWISFGNEQYEHTISTKTGTGWSYDESTAALTLNGLNAQMLSFAYMDADLTLVLAPGSKNVITRFDLTSLGGGVDYTTSIKGSGELIISDPTATEDGVFYGDCKTVKFLEGLTMTGGLKEGDNLKLTFKAFPNEYYTLYKLMAGDKPATYVRIAPAAGGAATGTAKPSGFTDVAADSPYAAAIQWAVGKNITTGKTADTFGPGDTCTVSHILTFLYRANGRPGAGDSERAAVIAWAQGLGIDTSSLSDPCTRAMAMTCLWKAAGSPAPSSTSIFPDIPAGADYADAVSWAVGKGVTTGKSAAAFAPNDPCTRGQIVTFLYRAMK